MPEPNRQPFSRVSWNQLRLRVPSNWSIRSVGARYLKFEADDGSIFEAKWNPVKGVFSAEKQLQRVHKQLDPALKKNFRKTPPPSGWLEALSAFQVSGFTWKGANVSGRGCLIHCPECRTTTLLQFIYPAVKVNLHLESLILASFQDHTPDDTALWSLFDLRASIPKTFGLVKHSFDAGRFTLSLARGRQRLHLYRWSPASFLLKGSSLTDFTRKRIDPAASPGPVEGSGGRAVEWDISPSNPGVFHRLLGLVRKDLYRRYRVWLVEERNRILGVGLESPRPFEPGLWEGICGGFETV